MIILKANTRLYKQTHREREKCERISECETVYFFEVSFCFYGKKKEMAKMRDRQREERQQQHFFVSQELMILL